MLAEPDNEELKKLKNDLKEIIALQEELTKTQQSADIPETPSTTTTSSKTEKDYSWKVGFFFRMLVILGFILTRVE